MQSAVRVMRVASCGRRGPASRRRPVDPIRRPGRERRRAGPGVLQRVHHFQPASTSSACGNSVRSPISTSSTSRSYASGLDSVNASPYWKSIVMSRTSMVVPGTFEPNLSVTPSSGCTRMTSWLCPSSSTSAGSNGRCGALLNMIGDLGDPPGQPLAGPDEERHAGPAAVLDAQRDRHVGLGGGVGGHALLLQVADHALAGHPAAQVLARVRFRWRCPRATRWP